MAKQNSQHANATTPVTPAATEEQPLVHVPSGGAVMAADFSEFEQDAPETFTKDDLALPFISIIQANSPELKKQQEDKFIPGARVGDLFHGITRRFWPGFADDGRTPPVTPDKAGLLALVVRYTPSYTQWWPRDSKLGKGFVKDWGANSDIMNSTSKDPEVNGIANPKGLPMLPDGTYIQDAALYYLLWVDRTTGEFGWGLASMKSTQRKKARAWNSLRQDLKVPKAGGGFFKPAPYFFNYVLTTSFESNDQGDWYGYKIDLNVGTDKKPIYTINLPEGRAIYNAAKEFDEMIGRGAVKIDHQSQGDAPNEPTHDDKF